MVFSEAKIADHLEEAKPLLLKHWQELESDLFPLDPDYDLYLKLESEGSIKSYAAKLENGKLVGYAVFIMRNHPHYKTVLVALCDVVFIHPSFRGEGMNFIQWCDLQLNKAGARIIEHHVKFINDFSPALIRAGYHPTEMKLQKRF